MKAMSPEQLEMYLSQAEQNAIKSLAKNKWERFGYWAAQSVHLRKILGVSHTASPFRVFSELAKKQLEGSEVAS